MKRLMTAVSTLTLGLATAAAADTMAEPQNDNLGVDGNIEAKVDPAGVQDSMERKTFATGTTVVTADGAEVGVIDRLYTDDDGIQRVIVEMDDAYADYGNLVMFRADTLADADGDLAVGWNDTDLRAALETSARVEIDPQDVQDNG